MRRLESVWKGNGGNSLSKWWKLCNPIVVAWNCMLIYASKYCPSLRLKNAILRLTGMKIGRGTRIALAAMFDIFYPEMIEIGENCVIGYNATILSHDFTVKEARKGMARIGNGVLIGANATVLAGVMIGDGAVVSAMTLVDADVPAGAYAEGVPMRISAKGKKGGDWHET